MEKALDNPKGCNREKLRREVVSLVKEFIEREGGVSVYDLYLLFGPFHHNPENPGVANALALAQIKFCEQPS